MSYLKVDTEVMAASATRIANAVDDIQALLNLLTDDVNTMLSGWTGDAAAAHRSLHERFQTDAVNIRDALLDMHDALLRTHTAYVTQESEQTADQVVAANQIRA